MTLLGLRLLGLAATLFYLLVGWGCYRLWNKKTPESLSAQQIAQLRGKYAAWAMFIWVSAMSIGHYAAGLLNNWE